MNLGELRKKMNEGLPIKEIVNSDLNLIGNNDDVDSVEDVTADGTGDSFINSVGQFGKNRGNAIVPSTIIEEDGINIESNLNKFPIVKKNVDVLVDSIKRNNLPPELISVIIEKIKQS